MKPPKQNQLFFILIFLIFIFSGFSFPIKKPPVDVPKSDSTSQQTYTIDSIAVPIFDSAYESKVITVIQLYWTDEFDFEEARKVLKGEGYAIKGWKTEAPPIDDFEEALKLSNQLWIISDNTRKLEPGHIELIKEFFEAGHGVYLIGDNSDYYADVNFIGNVLVNATLYGEYSGEQLITFPTDTSKISKNSSNTNKNNINNNNKYNSNNKNNINNNNKNNINNKNGNSQNINKTNIAQTAKKGKLMKHDITDGLTHLYEGITVSGLSSKSAKLNPVVYGSDNEILISTYEENDRRLILDGGFTRLYNSWDAQTSKYIQNVVKWLANTPRFESQTTVTVTTDSNSEYCAQTVVDSEATPEN